MDVWLRLHLGHLHLVTHGWVKPLCLLQIQLPINAHFGLQLVTVQILGLLSINRKSGLNPKL